ncbi:hypothetical protein HG15A2_25570 [Adhaeretor mobilis]|uniref:Uncharacterized protein n=1 Tax=Adhaeretor mobilis TaxID=1930276 RepID=A0A517MWI2_9BACT|nr:hypothetical protein HG15A2_25570 [Adhaeretor mobilis]
MEQCFVGLSIRVSNRHLVRAKFSNSSNQLCESIHESYYISLLPCAHLPFGQVCSVASNDYGTNSSFFLYADRDTQQLLQDTNVSY